MNEHEIRRLAAECYPGCEQHDSLFQLLVDVADAYVRELEDGAAEEPAPYLGGTTPLDAAMRGLYENLNMRREGGR